MHNLLLVSLDTLRADVAYSGRFPTINALRDGGTWFRTAVASAPFTPVSHATILTGLHPPAHGIRHLFRERLRPGVRTVAEDLAARGYETGAIVSCPGLNRYYGLDRGFGHYDDEIPRLPDGRDPLTLVDVKIRGAALKRAPVVVERAAAWLNARPRTKPFFLFVHFFDAHWPYEAPEQYGSLPNPYEGEVAYMDHYLGRLLDQMRRDGSLDDTLVVCLSDHGEDLGGWYEDDHAGKCGHPEEDGHGALLFDTTLLVPLIFVMPGVVPAGREVGGQVRLCDVTPTILDLLGLPVAEVDGASLRSSFETDAPPTHRPAYAETLYREELAASRREFADIGAMRALRLENRLKIVWEERRDRVDLYDLTRDPAEREPVALRRSGALLPLHTQDPPPRLDVVQAAFAGHPHLANMAEAAVRRLAERPGTGIALAGSAAAGRVDSHSDIDLYLAPPLGTDAAAVLAALPKELAALGHPLASFQAEHLGRPEILVTLLETETGIVKLDIEVSVPGTPRPRGLLWLRHPTGDDKTQSLSEAAAPDLAALCSRFAAWAWYANGCIFRGELREARAALDMMRERALLPVLQAARGLPLEGYRRFEERFSAADCTRVDATVPAAATPAELHRALVAMLGFFDGLQAGAAARIGVDHLTTTGLDRIAALLADLPPQ